jgi:hypothetical protein
MRLHDDPRYFGTDDGMRGVQLNSGSPGSSGGSGNTRMYFPPFTEYSSAVTSTLTACPFSGPPLQMRTIFTPGNLA